MNITTRDTLAGGMEFTILDEHGNFMVTAETWDDAMEFIAIFEG